MKKVLSLDGGGQKGLMTMQIVIAIEEKLQQRHGPDVRIADYFDMIAGTSTGGLCAAMLLHPKRYTARQVADLYLKYGSTIFKASWWDKLRYLFFGDKYSAKGLEQVLKMFIGDIKMSELTKPALITSYDITRRQSKFFAQKDKVDFFVKDVCRATSAAPTYFPPMRLKDSEGEVYNCIDGGMHSNNPALAALSEVANAVDHPGVKDIFILSLGTGLNQKPYSYKDAKAWGEIGWTKPVIDILMSSSAEVVDYHLRMLFLASKCSMNYIRIQPKETGRISPEMDCVTPVNNHNLVNKGLQVAMLRERTINRVVNLLLSDKDAVLFD